MVDRELYSREGEVTDHDIEGFERAILKAYPTKEFLYRRLANKWGIRVEDDVTSTDKPGAIIISRIVEFARSEGRLLDLLGLVWTDKPQNRALSELVEQWLDDKHAVLNKYSPMMPGQAPRENYAVARLEKLIEAKSRLVRLSSFIEGLVRISRAVCRVNIAQVGGTGFLIGRRTVLTNFHVVESAIKLGTKGDAVVCEFDFHDPATLTVRHAGRQGDGWLGPNSPYSASDLNGTGDPSDQELDFAIIYLDKEVEPDRLALELPESPPVVSQNDLIIIGQHPGGREAQLAIGKVVELPQRGLRYRYDVTTEAGSSGSPVLDLDLTLVGLHHAADPSINPTYNQGIPISRIKGKLAPSDFDFTAQ